MISNYISKIKLAFEVSNNFPTMFRLLLNSKKFNHAYNNKLIQSGNKNTFTQQYDFKFNNNKHKISMRTFAGDIGIFYEIFWNKSYSIPTHLGNNYKTIVDLGSHIGLSSIYFSTQYPNARIVCVEASDKNFQLLSNNVRQFQNINPIHAAAYPSDGTVVFENSNLSYNSKLSDIGTEIRALSMPTLMEEHNITKIDLMKIDIEGAETMLLSENCEWLNNVDNIIIEIHDEYSIDHLKSDLHKYGFKVFEPSANNQLKNIFASKNAAKHIV